MVTLKHKGNLQVANIRLTNLSPFQVTWEDFPDSDTIQIDVVGIGLLNYEGILTKGLEIEINTNILRALTRYEELTGHHASDIGYTLNLQQLKKFNQKHGTYHASVEISLFYKKPVKGASAYSLQPTSELIISIILDEIFILNKNVI